MKATGIVRRIDDVGRVVIPKEIRRALDIHEGDPLELFADGDKLICKKYDTSVDREKQAKEFLATHEDEIRFYQVRFSIDGDTTSCEAIYNNSRLTGVATRNPSDDFSPAIGMVYAYCRALTMRLPDGWE